MRQSFVMVGLFLCPALQAAAAAPPASQPAAPLTVAAEIDFKKQEVTVRFTNTADKVEVFFISPCAVEFIALYRGKRLITTWKMAEGWVNLPYLPGTLPLEDGAFAWLKPGEEVEMGPMPIRWLTFEHERDALVPTARRVNGGDGKGRGDAAGEAMEIFATYRVSGKYWDSESKKVVAKEGWVGETPTRSVGTFDAKVVER